MRANVRAAVPNPEECSLVIGRIPGRSTRLAVSVVCRATLLPILTRDVRYAAKTIPRGPLILQLKTWLRTAASNDGRIIFAGGVSLKQNDRVVGAVGVSGGSGEQDHAVAEAGAAAL